MSENHQNQSRRDFLKQLGLAAGGLALAPSALASSLGDRMSLGGRRLLDRIASPAEGLFLEDRGGDHYLIRSRGLPDHVTGGNFHSPILPQQNFFQITKTPKIAEKATPLDCWLFGIAVNGVVFDPTGPFWKGREETGYQFEVLSRLARPCLGIDFNQAHTQPSGEYHYHGMPVGLHQRLASLQARRGGSGMILLGYAADGFPVYAPLGHSNPRDRQSPLVPMRSSYVLARGQRIVKPGNLTGPGGSKDGSFVQDFEYRAGEGDLDECNGRFGVTPEFPQGTYHYFLTYDYPFIPRFWRGTPDPSFKHPKPGVDAVPEVLMNYEFV
jgi:hypothetical protein